MSTAEPGKYLAVNRMLFCVPNRAAKQLIHAISRRQSFRMPTSREGILGECYLGGFLVARAVLKRNQTEIKREIRRVPQPVGVREGERIAKIRCEAW
jgi:hypothetical protein